MQLKYHRKAETVFAGQWNKLGDLPDGELFEAPPVLDNPAVPENYKTPPDYGIPVAGPPFTAIYNRGPLVSSCVVAYNRENIKGETLCAFCGHPLAEHGWINPPVLDADAGKPVEQLNPVTGETVTLPLAPRAPAPPVSSVPAPLACFPVTYVKPGNYPRTVTNADEQKQAIADGFVTETQQAPVFPMTYVKPGNAPRMVNNVEEQKHAAAYGYVPLIPDAKPVASELTGLGSISVMPKPAIPATLGTVVYSKEGHPDILVTGDLAKKTALADGYVEAPVEERGDLEGLVVCPGDWVVTYPTGEREVYKPNVFHHVWTRP